MNKDRKLAKKVYGISKFPAIGLFRNGAEAENFVSYNGDLRNVAGVLNWLSDTETMEIPGIEIVQYMISILHGIFSLRHGLSLPALLPSNNY